MGLDLGDLLSTLPYGLYIDKTSYSNIIIITLYYKWNGNGDMLPYDFVTY